MGESEQKRRETGPGHEGVGYGGDALLWDGKLTETATR